MNEDMYYHKYLKYKVKYFNLLNFIRKNKIYVNNKDDLNNIEYNDMSIKQSNENSIKTISSENSIDDIDNFYINKILDIEKKIGNDFHKIIKYILLNNTENKTENEIILHNDLEEEIIEIYRKLNTREKKLLNNIDKNIILNLYKKSCDILNDKSLKLMKNSNCKTNKILDEIYINSELTDKVLNCPENMDFVVQFNKYIDNKYC